MKGEHKLYRFNADWLPAKRSHFSMWPKQHQCIKSVNGTEVELQPLTRRQENATYISQNIFYPLRHIEGIKTASNFCNLIFRPNIMPQFISVVSLENNNNKLHTFLLSLQRWQQLSCRPQSSQWSTSESPDLRPPRPVGLGQGGGGGDGAQGRR